MNEELLRRMRRELSVEQRADIALVLAIAALEQSYRRPRRKTWGERLWNLI